MAPRAASRSRRATRQPRRRRSRRGRNDEAGVEERRRDRERGRECLDAEPGEPGPEGGDADAREDERVPEGPAAEGRDRDADHGERPERVPDDGEDAGGPEVEDVLRLGDVGAGEVAGKRHGEGDPDCEPDVHERHRRDGASPCEEKRAGAEEGRTQERSTEVVDAERRVAPAGGRAPGEGPRGHRERAQRGGPRSMRRGATRPVAPNEVAGEAQREERGREREEGVHGRGL